MPHARWVRIAAGAIWIAIVFQHSAGETGHAQQTGVPAETPGFVGKTARRRRVSRSPTTSTSERNDGRVSCNGSARYVALHDQPQEAQDASRV